MHALNTKACWHTTSKSTHVVQTPSHVYKRLWGLPEWLVPHTVQSWWVSWRPPWSVDLQKHHTSSQQGSVCTADLSIWSCLTSAAAPTGTSLPCMVSDGSQQPYIYAVFQANRMTAFAQQSMHSMKWTLLSADMRSQASEAHSHRYRQTHTHMFMQACQQSYLMCIMGWGFLLV
jgi:hypothetical protein